MRRWLWNSSARIAALVGLLSLWVVDVAYNNPDVANGFWTISSFKAFHLGITSAVVAFSFVILRTWKGS